MEQVRCEHRKHKLTDDGGRRFGAGNEEWNKIRQTLFRNK